jgi:general secretion pathway protein D
MDQHHGTHIRSNMISKHLVCMGGLILICNLAFAQTANETKPTGVHFDDPILSLPEAIKNNYVENFDYPNADVKDLVEAIAKMTGKNFILAPNVRGKISIIGPSKITIQEAYYAFLTALEMNNLTIVPVGSFLQITFSRNARKSPIPLYTGDYSPPSSNYITRLYPLRYINADQVRREFSDMTTSAGKMYAYGPTNSLIITDTGANIQRIISILKILDVEGYQERMEVLPIKFASANEIASLLDTILEEGFTDKKARRSSKSTVAAKKTTGGGIISKIIADDRTNSLIILANDLGIKEVKKIIKILDQSEASSHAGNIHVYYCQHANAADLSKTLSSLVSSAKAASRARSGVRKGAGSTGDSGGLSGDIKITADTPTNSLVITASREGFESVLGVLEKLDIPRSQVFVEAVFLEVSINKGRTWDLSTNYSADANAPRVTGFVSNPGGLASFLAAGARPETAFSPDSPLAGFILGFSAGKKIELDVQGKKVEIGSIQGLMTFIENADNSEVLSRPTLMAMDNEEASIAIKNSVPSSQGFTTSVQGNTQNIQFVDTGIQLKITPQINAASGVVKLKLSQSVSEPRSAGVPQGLAAVATAVQSREANTTVIVPNGDTVAIGGLMRTKEEDNRKKVPLLGDIPILGWLFKSSQSKGDQTNLLMFITPHIVSTKNQMARVRQSQILERNEFIQDFRGGQDANENAARDLYNNDTRIRKQLLIDKKKQMQLSKSPPPYPDLVPTEELLNIEPEQKEEIKSIESVSEEKPLDLEL